MRKLHSALIIDDGDGPVPREEVERRVPITTLEDLDELAREEAEHDDVPFSWRDTRPLHEILGRRAGVPKPPEPAASQERVGPRLTEEQATQLATDALEILDLAHSLLIDSYGKRAAFPYELASVAKLHELAEVHRENRKHYAEKARQAQMLMDLHAIYEDTNAAWPRRVWDRASGRYLNPPKPDPDGRIMEIQRAALLGFCQKHHLTKIKRIVARLERDGNAIQEIRGPSNAADETLEKLAGRTTKEKPLTISPFEMTRARKRALVDAIAPGADASYDFAVDVVRTLFETLTETRWPMLSIDTTVKGWPRLLGDLHHGLVQHGLWSAPAKGPGRVPADPNSAKRRSMTAGFAWFVLRSLPKRPELLRRLAAEFFEDLEKRRTREALTIEASRARRARAPA